VRPSDSVGTSPNCNPHCPAPPHAPTAQLMAASLMRVTTAYGATFARLKVTSASIAAPRFASLTSPYVAESPPLDVESAWTPRGRAIRRRLAPSGSEARPAPSAMLSGTRDRRSAQRFSELTVSSQNRVAYQSGDRHALDGALVHIQLLKTQHAHASASGGIASPSPSPTTLTR
jgi:hypothetical protein